MTTGPLQTGFSHRFRSRLSAPRKVQRLTGKTDCQASRLFPFSILRFLWRAFGMASPGVALGLLWTASLAHAATIPLGAKIYADPSAGARARAAAGSTTVLYTVNAQTAGVIKSSPVLGVPIGGSGTLFDWYLVDWNWPADSRDGWSASAAFVYRAPLAPLVNSPGTEDSNSPEELSSTLVPFSWAPVSALEGSITTQYMLNVRDLDTPGQPVTNTLTSSTSHTLSLPVGHNFRWNVFAINGGQTSVVSATLWFYIRPPDVNLAPRGLDSWPQTIVLSRQSGTATDDQPFILGQDLYADVGVKNLGTASTGQGFVISVAVNETELLTFSAPTLSGGWITYRQDIRIPADRLQPGQNYVSVTADNGGAISETDEADNTFVRFFDVASSVAAPSSLTAENQDGLIKLDWLHSGTDHAGFLLERTRTDNATVATFALSGSSRSYSDATVLTGKEYCYRLRATNAAAASAFTPMACVTPQAAPAPEADIVADDLTPSPGVPVRFRNRGTTGSDYNATWRTSDGESKTGHSVSLTFNSTGSKKVYLTVSRSGFSPAEDMESLLVETAVAGTGQGGSSGNTQSVHGADPVNLASGSYYYQRTDLKLPGVGVPLEFIRHYDSKVNDPDGLPLGFGWSYTPFIAVRDNTTNAIVVYGDGHSEVHNLEAGEYKGDPGVFDRLVKISDNSWQVITKQQTTNHVNAAGQLTRIQDRNGNTITLDYETEPAAQGRLRQITDTVGRVTHFHPYADNPALIGRIEDVIGRSTWFTYNGNTNLVAVTNTLGHVTTFTYNDRHQITDAEDNRGHLIVHNDYNSGDNTVTNQVDAFGKTTGFFYDFTNHVTIQTNALGHHAVYRFDHRLLLTNLVDEAGFTNSYAYDTNRNRILIRDRNGNSADLVHDERGNVLGRTNALQEAAHATYDARNSPVRRLDSLTNELTLTYDGHGNLRFTTNALGFGTEIRYLPNGLPEIITDARGFSLTNVWENGNLIETINALGHRTRMLYDAAGRRTHHIDALNRTNRFVFDEADNLLHTVNALGQTNSTAFDANRNPAVTLDPRGVGFTNAFDLRDRVVTTVGPMDHTVTNLYDDLDRKVGTIDPRGKPTHFNLSPIGHLLSLTNALNEVTTFRRDPNGNPTNVVDAAEFITTNWFDALDRLVASVDPNGKTNLTAYDTLGRVIATTNANGQFTHFFYDALSRLTNVVDSERGEVSFAYDETGNRIRTADPNGHTWTNRFDPLGRLVEQLNPQGQRTLLDYDAVGNLTNRVTPNTDRFAYQYDALNRLTNILKPDGSTVSFAYDEAGNRTRMEDALGTTTWSFDLLNRPIGVSDPFEQVVSQRFDAAGNRVALRYPGGKEVHYGYDDANRLIALTNWLGGVVRYLRDPRGLVTNIVNANSTTVDLAYDGKGRLQSVVNRASDHSIIASAGANLDGVGNQPLRIDTYPLLPIGQTTNVTYSYDPDNRLTAVGSRAVTHDANGNLTGLGTDSYRFDAENRLLSYAVGGLHGGQYRYDGLGNRLEHTTNGVARRFVLDRLGSLTQVLAETDASGEVIAYYVYGFGLAQRITPDGQTDTYHFDLQGNTVLLTSATGERVAAYAYDAFGVLADSDEDRPQPFRYLGRYGIMDDGNGLYHARARFFSPHLGRFISQDPLWGNDASSQSWNRYVYALNNPTAYADVTGLKPSETSENDTSAYDLFWQWLTGRGPRSNTFSDGDQFIETLKQHSHVEATRQMIARNIADNGELIGNNNHSLRGFKGIPIFVKDYSAIITGGFTGNIAAAYLGSYNLSYDVTSIDHEKGTAVVEFRVFNRSTIASATHPPVFGYTEAWDRLVGRPLNNLVESGPLSQTTQTLNWSEIINWK